MMRVLTIILATTLLSGCQLAKQKASPGFVGVYSNNAEGFDTLTLMVANDGSAYFHVSTGGIIGEWAYNSPSSILSFEYIGLPEEDDEDTTIEFEYDSVSRSFLLTAHDELNERFKPPHDRLRFIAHEIPNEIEDALMDYSNNVEKAKAEYFKQREIHLQREERIQRRKEKQAREEPEIQEILHTIINNPDIVLEDELYLDGNDLVQQALQRSFRGEEVKYTEKMLNDLLEASPAGSSIRGYIFSSPQLSSKFIEQYYPNALEWEEHNYYVLRRIGSHPSTPIHILEDIEKRTDLPMGARHPALMQLHIRTVEIPKE